MSLTVLKFLSCFYNTTLSSEKKNWNSITLFYFPSLANLFEHVKMPTMDSEFRHCFHHLFSIVIVFVENFSTMACMSSNWSKWESWHWFQCLPDTTYIKLHMSIAYRGSSALCSTQLKEVKYCPLVPAGQSTSFMNNWLLTLDLNNTESSTGDLQRKHGGLR